MLDKFDAQYRTTPTTSQQPHSQPHLSWISDAAKKQIKTEQSLKKLHKSINNFYIKRKDPVEEIAYLSQVKPDSKYNLKRFPNLEKKTDIQRVKWFTRQTKEIERQQKSLKVLQSTLTEFQVQQKPVEMRQQQQVNEPNFINKYFVLKTPIKAVRYKERSTKLITTNSTIGTRYKQKKMLSLEQFLRENNDLRKHCTTQQDSMQDSVLNQLQINKLEHINLYSSVIKGVKNEILHREYKNGVKDLFDMDDKVNEQDKQTIQELYRKSVFKNPWLNNHKSQEIKINIPQQSFETPAHETKSERSKFRRKRVLLQIAVFLHWMYEHKISYEDLMTGSVFQETPYYSQKSKLCFQKLKANDYELVSQFIQDNRFLVFDYDHYKQTLLHHAVIRNYTDMTVLLLQHQAEVNSRDIQGRTPLYYAIRGKCNQCVQILLFFKASPWGNQKNNYDAYLDSLDSKVRDLYKKAKTNANLTLIKKESILGIITINIYIQMIVVILLIISISYAHEWDPNTKVKILSEAAFDSLKIQEDGLFVMLYAPWCPHCVKLIPAWELQAQNSNVAAVNCEIESRLCSRFQIKGFPSLIYIPPNSNIGYKFQGKKQLHIGQRSNDEFDKFIAGGWKNEGVIQLEILAEFTFFDQVKDYLSDPMLLGAITVIFLLVMMVFCLNSIDEAKEKEKQKVKKRE